MIVVEIGFRKYVLKTTDAVAIAEMLSKAERYDRTYIPEDERVDHDVEYIHHVWNEDNGIEMRVISDHTYQAAKLAGKKGKD